MLYPGDAFSQPTVRGVPLGNARVGKTFKHEQVCGYPGWPREPKGPGTGAGLPLLPVRWVYIPKRGDAKQQRPIGVTALEDKIVQRATVAALNAIYEPEFAGFSYGARPGRSAHQALTALDQAIEKRRVKWVLDADLRDFFGSLEHAQLIRFVEHRIGDKRVVRLIRLWLAAGVLEDGAWTPSETGTPQGTG